MRSQQVACVLCICCESESICILQGSVPPLHRFAFSWMFTTYCTLPRGRAAQAFSLTFASLQDNIIRFNTNPFWKERYCPKHRDDGTLQCCSCTRLCPQGEQWVTELDGRTVCLDCLATIVRDTPDAQPLYDQVCDYPVFALPPCHHSKVVFSLTCQLPLCETLLMPSRCMTR